MFVSDSFNCFRFDFWPQNFYFFDLLTFCAVDMLCLTSFWEVKKQYVYSLGDQEVKIGGQTINCKNAHNLDHFRQSNNPAGTRRLETPDFFIFVFVITRRQPIDDILNPWPLQTIQQSSRSQKTSDTRLEEFSSRLRHPLTLNSTPIAI